jgi:hypothetical protein
VPKPCQIGLLKSKSLALWLTGSALIASSTSAFSSGTAQPSHSERTFPLSGGTSRSAADPAQRLGTDEALRQDPSTASQSHLGRDATFAGAGAAGAGALAHEAGKGDDDVSQATYTDRSYRLGADEAARPDPTTASQSHLGRDAALAGAGAAEAGALAHEAGKNKDDVSQATYTDRSYRLGGDSASPVSQQPIAGTSTSTRPTEPSTTAAAAAAGVGKSTGARSSAEIPADSFGYHKPDEKPVEGYVHHTQGPHATVSVSIII